MIGDDYEADVLGANNIGMDAIFFNSKNEIEYNTTHIPKIAQLIDLKEYL